MEWEALDIPNQYISYPRPKYATCIAHARTVLEILEHDLLLGGERPLLPREVLAVVVVLLEVRYVERIVDVGYPRRLDLLLHELREIHLLEEGVILDVAVPSRETSWVVGEYIFGGRRRHRRFSARNKMGSTKR